MIISRNLVFLCIHVLKHTAINVQFNINFSNLTIIHILVTSIPEDEGDPIHIQVINIYSKIKITLDSYITLFRLIKILMVKLLVVFLCSVH